MLDPGEILERVLKNNLAPVILYEKAILSGNELYQKASELAVYFATKNIVAGDRIAVHLPNCVEFIFCYIAGILGGYTIVPINPSLPPQDVNYILEVTTPKLFIQAIEELHFVKKNLPPPRSPIPNLINTIFFTSGTTSRPKGVCHTAESMFANALAFNELVGLDHNTRMLHIMPMGYMAGFLNTVLCPILAGGSIVISAQFSAKEAINFWHMAVKHQINALWITPSIAAFLARINRDKELTDWTKKQLRHVLVGTAPLPHAIKEKFESTFGVECLESYGMTEVMLVSSNSKNYPRKKGATGHLLKNIHIETRDPSGAILKPGQEGALYINTPFVMLGYFQRNDNIVLTDTTWLATGDCGYVDDDGNLFITGRIKDLIIHGGTNVSPRAVEEVLLQHADIEDAAVLGKPHPFWGEEVVAFLILKHDKKLDIPNISMFCQRNLMPDAVPSLFKVLTDFPRASTGKVQTNKLRELV